MKTPTYRQRVRAMLVTFVWLAGCTGGSTPRNGLTPAVPNAHFAAATRIRHIVVIVQENRSFDNLFATFPGADGAKTGLMAGTNGGDVAVPLKMVPLTDTTNDFEHSFRSFATEYDRGRMDGFGSIAFTNRICNCFKPAGTRPYQYVDPADIAPYWSLARQYGLADRLFQTQRSGSFTAHLDLIAGTTALSNTSAVVDWPAQKPWGCDSPYGTVTNLLVPSPFADGRVSLQQLRPDAGPFPCYKWTTIADRLDDKHVSWKYYTPPLCRNSGCFGDRTLWNAFDAIRPVRYGPDWKNDVVTPEKSIFTDISADRLAAVSWVIPDNENSDHPSYPSDTGPSWVAQVVNAVGESSYWKSTAIVVLWDDWGGFYDHERPPKLDFQGLGFRVPMIVISPYVPQGEISHTQYEFGSILRFINETFDLEPLNTTDVRASSIGGMFDFDRAPRAFKTISAKYSRAYFLRQPPSYLPVDDE